jgi:N,N'-diacetyllegionaminate synthase
MNTKNNYFSQFSRNLIIAEIGVNHNGDMHLARRMIEEAKRAGADAVKFQTYSADKLVSSGTPKVPYQKSTTSKHESHYEMIKRLELPKQEHAPLKLYCDQVGIMFLSTPYDIESANFLLNLGIDFFKTASADLVDLPLHNYIASTRKPVLVSVGMATLGEIEKVISTYRNFASDHLALLHCVSNYPCSDVSLNMRVINTLQQTFQLPVGYSDHSVGSEASILAVALGGCVIEKHFTLDKNLPGPDHKASSTPEEFSVLVRAVRRAEDMLGSPVKRCQKEEEEMARISRKSLHLAIPINAGQHLTLEHISMKRPGTGLPATMIEYLLGKIARRDLECGYQLRIADFQ